MMRHERSDALTITCDHPDCGISRPTGHLFSGPAREAMQAQGWTFVPTDRAPHTYCPDHKDI